MIIDIILVAALAISLVALFAGLRERRRLRQQLRGGNVTDLMARKEELDRTRPVRRYHRRRRQESKND